MSAYKRTLKSGFGEDSDESMSDVVEHSISTSGEDSSEESVDERQVISTSTSTASDATVPTELRNRVLMLTSRGVSYRHRHLLADLHLLLPHTFKDTKLDTKSNNNYNAALNGLADLNSCNYIFFLEGRKHAQDLYLWLAKAPNGPTVKFSVSNIHTMGELGFGGNCLKGGRGIVVFDKSFEENVEGGEYKQLIRELLRGVFCVPAKGVRGMKPFVDRVVGIFGLDGKIWIRIYEIREGDKNPMEGEVSLPESDVSLVEVGPRMVLTPIVILEGSFGGPVIYENKQYVSPNQIRAEARVRQAGAYANRKSGDDDRFVKKRALGLEHGTRKPSSLDDAVIFA